MGKDMFPKLFNLEWREEGREEERKGKGVGRREGRREGGNEWEATLKTKADSSSFITYQLRD